MRFLCIEVVKYNTGNVQQATVVELTKFFNVFLIVFNLLPRSCCDGGNVSVWVLTQVFPTPREFVQLGNLETGQEKLVAKTSDPRDGDFSPIS